MSMARDVGIKDTYVLFINYFIVHEDGKELHMATTNVSINKIVNDINEYNNNPLAVLTYISEEIFPWYMQITRAMSIETFLAFVGATFDDYFESKGIEMEKAREYMRDLCKVQENVHSNIPCVNTSRKDGEHND